MAAVHSDPLRPAPDTVLDATAYAGFWRRAAAALIDLVVVGIAILLLALVVVASFEISRDRWGVGDLVYWVGNVVLFWLYFAGLESGRRQATLGKRLLRLRVIDLDGEPISFGRATLRHFAKFLSLLPLTAGFLAVAFTPRRQGLHDIIAGCLVLCADR